MRRSLWVLVVVLLSTGALERPSAAAPVLTPIGHDFGKAPVGLTRAIVETVDQRLKFTFRITLGPDDGDPAAVQFSITGNAPADFSVDAACTHIVKSQSQCDIDVYVLPHSRGAKSATLTASANGHTSNADLAGAGIGGGYSGHITYQHTIVGSHG